MFELLKKIFPKPKDTRDGWLTASSPDLYELSKDFQETGLININNRICLMQDPATKQYWIEHLIDVGEGSWCEYQPISQQAALDLKSDPALFQEYVLHPWVKSDAEKFMETNNRDDDSR